MNGLRAALARWAWLAVVLLAGACGGAGSGPPDSRLPAVCGNGLAEDGEDCDGGDLRGKGCDDYGFNSGTLVCHPACVVDLRGCSNLEVCDNGEDDDGDGDKDCDDADCVDAVACAVCGDRLVTGSEQCDDGNSDAGDCCDADCQAEPGCEREPNDSPAAAMPLSLAADGTALVKGQIHPGDVDVLAIVIPQGATATLTARITGGAFRSECYGDLDSLLEVLDADAKLVAEDDDSGDGTCSLVSAGGLAPGHAFVRVSASPFALPDAAFDYQLTVALALAPCGDGVIDEGQECDDGNTDPGDGCSSACRYEPILEVEPDDVIVHAVPVGTPPFVVAGTIDPPQEGNYDSDWYQLDIGAPANLKVETHDDSGAADCAASSAQPFLYSFAGGQLVLLAVGQEATDGGCEVLYTYREGWPAAAPEPEPVPGPGEIPLLELLPGSYYIQVLSRPAPGRYKMYVTYISRCGNGAVEPPEECESGAGCDDSCMRIAVCGDGLVDFPEQCDDMNNMDADGCSSTCRIEASPLCGNGLVDRDSEGCDDGNHVDGDCCSAICFVESGCEDEPNDAISSASPLGIADYPLTIRGNLSAGDVDVFAFYLPFSDLRLETFDGAGAPSCADPLDTLISVYGEDARLRTTADDGGPGLCSGLTVSVDPGATYIVVTPAPSWTPAAPTPYQLVVSLASVCGDGVVSGSESCEGCGPTCGRLAVCGDGIVTAPETCDDANTAAGDGCSPSCLVELPPGPCGDGQLNAGEECDDGNTGAGDGCSPTCLLEPPPVACGDGILSAGEGCDDSNTDAGDGCSPTCQVEAGHHYEQEPNDDGQVAMYTDDFLAGAADGPFGADVSIHAAIEPLGDDDVFAVVNPGAAPLTVHLETFGAGGPGACDGVDTQLKIRDASGVELAFDDDSGLGFCSALDLELAPATTVYAQVIDFGDNSLIPSYQLQIDFP